jgi:hypothetical protein
MEGSAAVWFLHARALDLDGISHRLLAPALLGFSYEF